MNVLQVNPYDLKHHLLCIKLRCRTRWCDDATLVRVALNIYLVSEVLSYIIGSSPSVDNFIVVIMLLILWILMLIAEKHYFGIIIVISFVFITTRMDTKDVLLNVLWFSFLLLISNFALNYIIFISMNHSI